MQKLKVKIKNGGKSLELVVRKVGFLGKVLGFMFRTRGTSPLLFEFRKKGRKRFHSLFVFFSFFLVSLDDENNVIETTLVKPFCFEKKVSFLTRRIIEIPIDERRNEITSFLVGEKSLNMN